MQNHIVFPPQKKIPNLCKIEKSLLNCKVKYINVKAYVRLLSDETKNSKLGKIFKYLLKEKVDFYAELQLH